MTPAADTARGPAKAGRAAAAPNADIHIPVLLDEVIEALAPEDGALYVDGTFGAGGYTAALLDAADCEVIGIDRDPDAQKRAAPLLEKYGKRLRVIEGRFGDMETIVRDLGITAVQGVALDVGVSSAQIDDHSRGFSFLRDGPLDMRMEKSGRTAADVVNTFGEQDLADIIYQYGEERLSRRIAKAIVAARAEMPITRTSRLADVIRANVRRGGDGIDPATRTFQALRVYVNDEIGELQRGLAGATALLAPGGRLAVVSFHSLEDREVKTFFRAHGNRQARPSRHLPDAAQQAGSDAASDLHIVTRRAIRPGKAELARNVRARSARLRVAEKIGPGTLKSGAAKSGRTAR